MGTALVMEHANALAQMIVSEKDKLFDERVEALVKLYRRAEFYLKQGFLESIVCEFHRKKVEMIMQAETKGEITEILKLSKPHFDGKKFSTLSVCCGRGRASPLVSDITARSTPG